MSKYFKIKGRSRAGGFILARSRKEFFLSESALIRRKQLDRILPTVPLLVSPTGEIFLPVFDPIEKQEVRFNITGVKQFGDKRLGFTKKKEIRN